MIWILLILLSLTSTECEDWCQQMYNNHIRKDDRLGIYTLYNENGSEDWMYNNNTGKEWRFTFKGDPTQPNMVWTSMRNRTETDFKQRIGYRIDIPANETHKRGDTYDNCRVYPNATIKCDHKTNITHIKDKQFEDKTIIFKPWSQWNNRTHGVLVFIWESKAGSVEKTDVPMKSFYNLINRSQVADTSLSVPPFVNDIEPALIKGIISGQDFHFILFNYNGLNKYCITLENNTQTDSHCKTPYDFIDLFNNSLCSNTTEDSLIETTMDPLTTAKSNGMDRVTILIIVGIIVGIVAIAIVIGLIWFCLRKRKPKKVIFSGSESTSATSVTESQLSEHVIYGGLSKMSVNSGSNVGVNPQKQMQANIGSKTKSSLKVQSKKAGPKKSGISSPKK